MKPYSSITRGNSRQNSRTRRLRLLVVLGAVTFLVAAFFPWLIRGVGAVIVLPISYVSSWVENSSSFIPTLIRDRQALEAELRELEGEVATLTVLYENERAMAVPALLRDTPGISASVIAQPPLTPYDSLIINAGRQHGIEVGAPVYGPGDTLIGTVETVYERSAVVVPITTPGIQHLLYLFGPNIHAIATGEGGGMLRLGVPQGVALAVGDTAVAPILEGATVGRVVSIRSVPTEPEQYAYVTLPVALRNLHTVTVGQPPEAPPSRETIEAIIDEASLRLFGVTVTALEEVAATTSTSTLTSTSTPEQ